MFAQIARDRKIPDWLNTAEPAVVFGLIMLYIWRLRYTAPSSWILILGIVLLSHVLRDEHPEMLGFRTGNFRECVREYFAPLLFVSLALVSTGLLLRSTRDITFDRGLACFLAYCPWGLFQQYLMNSYFGQRLQAASPRHVSALSASLFAAGHLPNLFLMTVTLVMGYFCSKIYWKHRNLYFLGLAHATIGFLLYWIVPDAISHHLNVGPNCFR